MKQRTDRWAAVLAALIGSAFATLGDGRALAQGANGAELQRAIADYEDFDYAHAASRLARLLRAPHDLAPNDRALAYQYLAFSDALSGEDARAIESFEGLLDLEPGFDLPATTSPTLLQELQRAKAVRAAARDIAEAHALPVPADATAATSSPAPTGAPTHTAAADGTPPAKVPASHPPASAPPPGLAPSSSASAIPAPVQLAHAVAPAAPLAGMTVTVREQLVDPGRRVARIVLYYRSPGARAYSFALGGPAADRAAALLEVPGPLVQSPGLDLYAVARDSSGIDLAMDGAPDAPIWVPVGPQPAPPLYQRRWFWGAVVGGGLTAAVLAAVLLWPSSPPAATTPVTIVPQ